MSECLSVVGKCPASPTFTCVQSWGKAAAIQENIYLKLKIILINIFTLAAKLDELHKYSAALCLVCHSQCVCMTVLARGPQALANTQH